MSEPFGLSQRPNKMPWFDFIRATIVACENSDRWENKIPREIHVNPKEIGFLGNAKGVSYKSHNIPIKTNKTCIASHIQVYF